MADQKITDEQKDEIFREYIKLKRPSERYGFQARMAEKYGVHRCTITRIVRNEKRIAKYEKAASINQRLAMLQLNEAAMEAIGVATDIICDETLPANMAGVRLNAAIDIMNRAGFRRKEEESERRMVITFGDMPEGLKLGAPPESDEDG